MTIPDALAEEFGLISPSAFKCSDMPLALAYHRFFQGLRDAGDGAIVFDEWDTFTLSDGVDLDDQHELARHVIALACVPEMREHLLGLLAYDRTRDWPLYAHEVVFVIPLDNYLTPVEKLFLKLSDTYFRLGHQLYRRSASEEVLGSVYWEIGLGSPGTVYAQVISDAWAIVLGNFDTRGNYWTNYVPVLLGFARRERLYRSIARVLTETVGQGFSVPYFVSGSGFEPFEFAFLAASIGVDNDQSLGELLLAVDEHVARQAFERRGGAERALIQWATFGCTDDDLEYNDDDDDGEDDEDG